MTLTKESIANSLHQQIEIPKTKSTDMVESLLEIVKNTLEDGEDVLISGFGKFCVREKKQRKGRNPATGADLTLDSRRVVTFKCSSVLKAKLNGKR